MDMITTEQRTRQKDVGNSGDGDDALSVWCLCMPLGLALDNNVALMEVSWQFHQSLA
jgi:hypothetical protein